LAGLVPAIHVLPRAKKGVDARIRGHDDRRVEKLMRFEKQGMAPVANQPADFARHLQAELTRWGQVIKDAGIKPE
jgi:tripartite-type tricarboxylate transporter receptor subunit TctC